MGILPFLELVKARIYLLILSIIFAVFFGLPTRVFATSAYINPCPGEPVTSFCNINQILGNNIKVLNSLLVGTSDNPGSFRSSAANTLISGVDMMIKTPPASGRDYLSYMGSRFHVPGTPIPAYAAGGTGYTALAPVLKIWTAMRNLAYFAFAIIFVVIGVMILVRSKIDPKTTINIQNALPKIILALVLVTFSYAIAGFLVDLLYVATNLVLTMIRLMGFPDIEVNIRYGLANQPLIGFIFEGAMGGTITSGAAAVGNVVDSFVTNMPVVGVGGAVLGFVTSGLAFLIIAVAVIFALFKAWLMLLSAYANIILGIIFSPLQLMMDAIPGQNQFSGWLRTMLANILAFPAVLIMIFLAMALGTNMGNGVAPTDKYSGFVPPFIGGNSQVAIQSLIGIALLLTIPKAIEMIQKAIKAPKNEFGNAWGENLNAARAGLTTFGSAAKKKYEEGGLSGYSSLKKEAVAKGRVARGQAQWERGDPINIR